MLLKKGNFTGNNSEELATNDWNPIQTAIGHKTLCFLEPLHYYRCGYDYYTLIGGVIECKK